MFFLILIIIIAVVACLFTFLAIKDDMEILESEIKQHINSDKQDTLLDKIKHDNTEETIASTLIEINKYLKRIISD